MIKNSIKFWVLCTILVCGLVVTSCSDNYDNAVEPVADDVEAQMKQMTMREKIGQMFFIRPESLDPTVQTQDLASLKMQAVTQAMKDHRTLCDTYDPLL